MPRKSFPSYKTHYWCPQHRWVPQEKCIDEGYGLLCPECGKRVKTTPKRKGD